MVPVMSLHDILVVFVAGIVIGTIVTAYLIHKVRGFIKAKLK